MPVGEKEENEYLDLFRVYAELLSPFFIICKDLSFDEWDKHFKLYKEYYKKANIEGDDHVLKELGDKLQNYSTEECEHYCMRWGDLIYIYPKKYIENHKFSTFENIQIPVSKYVETMMRIAYGDDWMYVPKIKNQIIHPHLENYTTSCLEYSNRYLPKINREEVLKKYKNIKYSNLSSFAKNKRIEILIAKINVNSKAKNISKLNEKEEYLFDLLKNKDYKSIISEFKDYTELQLRSDIKKYNIFVPIPDKNLEILLTCLIEKGEYYNVDNYLNIRKIHDKNLSDGLINVENLVKCCRELSIARYDKKDEKLVQSLINKYEIQYNDLLDIHRAKLWISEIHAKSKEDYENIDKTGNEILKKYPFDGEIMAVQAKAKAKCGKKSESIELYNKAINNTRNGLIWKKIEEETGISRYKMEYDLIEEVKE